MNHVASQFLDESLYAFSSNDAVDEAAQRLLPRPRLHEPLARGDPFVTRPFAAVNCH
jgi:hypothetical protein